MKIPLTIVTGYPKSGKTELIQKIQRNRKIEIIKNSTTLEIKEAVMKSPDIIIIELPEIRKLSKLISIIKGVSSISLNNIITVIDSDEIVRHSYIGKYRNVIEKADMILLNKRDLVTKEQMKQAKKLIRSINTKALIFTSKHCEINTSLLFNSRSCNKFKVLKATENR